LSSEAIIFVQHESADESAFEYSSTSGFGLSLGPEFLQEKNPPREERRIDAIITRNFIQIFYKPLKD
jgi:hypothetical protein